MDRSCHFYNCDLKLKDEHSLTDLCRLATAIVITIPSCYYILQPFATHDSGHGHEEHAEQSHGEKGEGEGKEEKADDEGKAEKSGEGNDEGGDDKSDSDSKGSPAKKEYKGPESRGTEIGKGVSSGSADDQGKKQEGLSNTDTKHSIDISQSPEQSKKGEGTAETAKVKGTIKPDRPTVCPLPINRLLDSIANMLSARANKQVRQGRVDFAISSDSRIDSSPSPSPLKQ